MEGMQTVKSRCKGRHIAAKIGYNRDNAHSLVPFTGNIH